MLVLEILGVRLLAPYVGLTLETTTSIIGVVLAAIAAGSALGGRAADRLDPRRLLTGLLVAGGVLALLTAPLVRLMGDAPGLVAAAIALVPPAAVLSAVTPTVARLQLSDLGRSGTVVGRLSAWATAGALAGTFGTGFVLVPLLSVTVSVLLAGLLLIVAGLAFGAYARALAAGTAAALVLVAGAAVAVLLAVDSPCEVETDYHCATVTVDSARAGGRVLTLDDLRHSYVDLGDPRHLEFDYVRWLADSIRGLRPRSEPLDAVFAGGGGFTLPRWLLADRPGSRARVLEVDGDVVELARRRLGLRTSAALQVTVGDARVTLRRLPAESADLVVGDAFGAEAVPWHLATAEWLRDVRRVLRPGGLYALNVIDRGPLSLFRAQAATLLREFRDVRAVALPGPVGPNLILLASDRPLPRGVGSRARGAGTLDRAAVRRLAAGADPLRDDDAPADQLLSAR